MRATNYNSLTM